MSNVWLHFTVPPRLPRCTRVLNSCELLISLLFFKYFLALDVDRCKIPSDIFQGEKANNIMPRLKLISLDDDKDLCVTIKKNYENGGDIATHYHGGGNKGAAAYSYESGYKGVTPYNYESGYKGAKNYEKGYKGANNYNSGYKGVSAYNYGCDNKGVSPYNYGNEYKGEAPYGSGYNKGVTPYNYEGGCGNKGFTPYSYESGYKGVTPYNYNGRCGNEGVTPYIYGGGFWTNPCQIGPSYQDQVGGDAVEPYYSLLSEISKKELNTITVTSQVAIHHYLSFIDQYVTETFQKPLAQHLKDWEGTPGYPWLPRLPKQLNQTLPKEFKSKLELENALLDSYEYLQRVAVGMEAVAKDHNFRGTKFQDNFKQSLDELRTVLCEVNSVMANFKIKMRPDIQRSVMPDKIRHLKSDTDRHLRDWLIFRDYMNVMEFVLEIFTHLIDQMQ